MTELAVVDDMIGDHAFAVNLIAYPSGQTKEILCAFQDLIFDGMPADTLYRCPEFSLHMSVFQFVHSRKTDSPHQVSIWNKHYERIDRHLQSLTSEIEVCVLGPPTVYVSETAVIIKFVSSPVIELLRDNLEVFVQHCELAWNRPAIQHITIIRYAKPFLLSEIVNKISEIKLPVIAWNIGTLNLVQEDIYPSLDSNLVKIYRLGQRH